MKTTTNPKALQSVLDIADPGYQAIYAEDALTNLLNRGEITQDEYDWFKTNGPD